MGLCGGGWTVDQHIDGIEDIFGFKIDNDLRGSEDIKDLSTMFTAIYAVGDNDIVSSWVNESRPATAVCMVES